MLADREHGIMDLWRVCRSDLEGLTQRTAGSFLRSIKFRVMDRIIESAGKNARLSGYDDNIYGCAKYLAGIYCRAIEYFELHSAELNTFSIKNPILDIYKVLNEQLLLFEAQSPGNDENPVALERVKLLSAGVAYFLLSFNDSENIYPNTRLRASELAGQFTPEYFAGYIDNIQNDIIKCFMDNNYPAYKKAVTACISGLNSFQERKTLLYYYTLLSGEFDVLTFISRQTSEIVRELSRNAGNSVEFEIVGKFMSIVSEAQLFYNKECQNLMAFFKGPDIGAAHEPESPESLCSACGDMLANSRLIAQKDYQETGLKYRADIQLIKTHMEDNAQYYTEPVLERLDISVFWEESAKRTEEKLLQAKRVAESIVCVFARQVSYYRENSDKFSDLPESEIIKGINETLIIKAEVLSESISAFGEYRFHNNGDEITFSIKESGQLIGELFEILRARFLNESDDENIISNFYNDAVNAETITAYRRRVSDICQKEEEGAEKTIKRFLKDSVLYEISTFEEILQYSVTRLRESDNDYVKDYIEIIDGNALIIENTLNRAGITMIRPDPHDNFNGKEHEILMAEHIDGFAKGEIIKYMTSGYRLNGQVLIRANIIAAK